MDPFCLISIVTSLANFFSQSYSWKHRCWDKNASQIIWATLWRWGNPNGGPSTWLTGQPIRILWTLKFNVLGKSWVSLPKSVRVARIAASRSIGQPLLGFTKNSTILKVNFGFNLNYSAPRTFIKLQNEILEVWFLVMAFESVAQQSLTLIGPEAQDRRQRIGKNQSTHFILSQAFTSSVNQH